MPSFAPTNPIQNQSEAQPAPQEPMVAQNGIETAQPKAQAPMEMSLRGGEYAGCNCCGCGCSESCC